jgi:hypothetical protein
MTQQDWFAGLITASQNVAAHLPALAAAAGLALAGWLLGRLVAWQIGRGSASSWIKPIRWPN